MVRLAWVSCALSIAGCDLNFEHTLDPAVTSSDPAVIAVHGTKQFEVDSFLGGRVTGVSYTTTGPFEVTEPAGDGAALVTALAGGNGRIVATTIDSSSGLDLTAATATHVALWRRGMTVDDVRAQRLTTTVPVAANVTLALQPVVYGAGELRLADSSASGAVSGLPPEQDNSIENLGPLSDGTVLDVEVDAAGRGWPLQLIATAAATALELLEEPTPLPAPETKLFATVCVLALDDAALPILGAAPSFVITGDARLIARGFDPGCVVVASTRARGESVLEASYAGRVLPIALRSD